MIKEAFFDGFAQAYFDYLNQNAQVKEALYREAVELDGIMKQAEGGYGMGAMLGAGAAGIGLGAAGMGIYNAQKRKQEEEAYMAAQAEQDAMLRQQLAQMYGNDGYYA